MEMVCLKNNIPLTNTKIIEKYTNVKHQNILQLFRRHEKSIKKFGVIMFETCKPKKGSKGGRPETFYYLNEEQFTFFIMLMANSEKVVKFKMKINREFHFMRKWILEQKIQKANIEYIETRKQSKIGRKEETDIIKTFVEYATKQGSKNAKNYYMLISKMENKAFFLIKQKFKNVREILNITQLRKIMFADLIIRHVLLTEMEKGTEYHKIYEISKEEVLKAAGTLPKEIIPGIEFKQISIDDLSQAK